MQRNGSEWREARRTSSGVVGLNAFPAGRRQFSHGDLQIVVCLQIDPKLTSVGEAEAQTDGRTGRDPTQGLRRPGPFETLSPVLHGIAKAGLPA